MGVWRGRRLADPRCMDHSANRANVHHCALGLDEQRHEGFGHAQDAPEIHVKDFFPSFDVDLRERDGVARTGIVNKIIKPTDNLADPEHHLSIIAR